MKNNCLILILFIYSICIFNSVNANEIEFKAKEIEIIYDKNLTIAIDAETLIKKDNIFIKGKKIEYFEKESLLKITNGILINKDLNLELKSNIINYDIKDAKVLLKNDIEIISVDDNLEIKSNELIFNIIEKKLTSNTKTTITDEFDNKYKLDSFTYNLDRKIIILNNSEIIDSDNNSYFFEKAYLDLDKKQLLAKDIKLNFKNSSSNDNDPRLYGRSFVMNSERSVIKKGNLTFCKKRDNCPPWQITADEIIHDKKKKTIYYNNASLKIYDKSVVYFPKFFHPDPSVERKSGFLFPTFQDNSNIGLSLNIPYFWVISDNKDITFNPRMFNDDKLLLQTEYRQKNLDSFHIADFSQFLSGDGSSKGHFFYNFSKEMFSSKFNDVLMDVNIEQVSNDTYLKTFEIDSPIIKNENNLTNKLSFDIFGKNSFMNLNFEINEDLSKNKSDRYEYIPNFNLLKTFDNSGILSEKYSWYSEGSLKNFNTNITEKKLLNRLSYQSDQKVLNNGFVTQNNFLITNQISDGKNSLDYKNHFTSNVVPVFEKNYSIPMQKEVGNNQSLLTPRFSVRVGPEHTKNQRNIDRIIKYDNIFDINRLQSSEINEGGIATTVGYDFISINKTTSNEIFKIGLANNIRFKENNDLPSSSNLGKKNSDLVGVIKYSPNENFKFNYDFSLKNNLLEKNYELMSFDFFIKGFSSKFEYLNENNNINKSSFLINETSLALNESNSLTFETRKNKELDFTEYYNLLYQYENDCLKAGIEYRKNYYSDVDLKPTENLFFKISILPFGGANSPNLIN
jgi:LPS-assembly protein